MVCVVARQMVGGKGCGRGGSQVCEQSTVEQKGRYSARARVDDRGVPVVGSQAVPVVVEKACRRFEYDVGRGLDVAALDVNFSRRRAQRNLVCLQRGASRRGLKRSPNGCQSHLSRHASPDVGSIKH
jgi:hypothetical protein